MLTFINTGMEWRRNLSIYIVLWIARFFYVKIKFGAEKPPARLLMDKKTLGRRWRPTAKPGDDLKIPHDPGACDILISLS